MKTHSWTEMKESKKTESPWAYRTMLLRLHETDVLILEPSSALSRMNTIEKETTLQKSSWSGQGLIFLIRIHNKIVVNWPVLRYLLDRWKGKPTHVPPAPKLQTCHKQTRTQYLWWKPHPSPKYSDEKIVQGFDYWLFLTKNKKSHLSKEK